MISVETCASPPAASLTVAHQHADDGGEAQHPLQVLGVLEAAVVRRTRRGLGVGVALGDALPHLEAGRLHAHAHVVQEHCFYMLCLLFTFFCTLLAILAILPKESKEENEGRVQLIFFSTAR